jgi:hypothetical protein
MHSIVDLGTAHLCLQKVINSVLIMCFSEGGGGVLFLLFFLSWHLMNIRCKLEYHPIPPPPHTLCGIVALICMIRRKVMAEKLH